MYDLASKITEMSQSKKLLAIYEDILWRIQAIIEVNNFLSLLVKIRYFTTSPTMADPGFLVGGIK